jgi:uncharacterized protein YciI
MKKILAILLSFLFLVIAIPAISQKDNAPQIKQFWFVMLTKGDNRTQDSVTAAKIQAAHLANIGRLYNEGKLKVAGPFDDDKWIGLFIFDCETKEEVEKLVKADPAIAAGRLAYEIKPWYTVPSGSFSPGKPAKPLF